MIKLKRYSIITLILLVIFFYFLICKNLTVEKFDNNTNIKILCINLDKAKDRWNKVNKKFNKLGFTIERFPAINGKEVKYEEYKDLVKLEYNTDLNAQCDSKTKPGLTLKLSPGEIGCNLSHCKIWQKMVNENINKCMVIEDDIVPYDNLKNYNKYLDKVPKNWDLVYISFINTGKKNIINKEIYKPTCGFSTSGYILNLKGAKKLLKFIPMEGSTDIFLLNLFKNNYINAYVIDGVCDSSNTWGGNDSAIEHSSRNIGKYKV